ncbi:hypothetical protein K457DRAFT_690521 [Linnemannia elongata AG-77]|uniref:Uncharacterized protein n=1 Tax=Linnemannia elongata AG-77 TaxID=1314771 RepID=A0A197JPW9_9FUNG|nr:hypothetical protein K457DRAFT_690521 [Linnemannia elongata AG-77]
MAMCSCLSVNEGKVELKGENVKETKCSLLLSHTHIHTTTIQPCAGASTTNTSAPRTRSTLRNSTSITRNATLVHTTVLTAETSSWNVRPLSSSLGGVMFAPRPSSLTRLVVTRPKTSLVGKTSKESIRLRHQHLYQQKINRHPN